MSAKFITERLTAIMSLAKRRSGCAEGYLAGDVVDVKGSRVEEMQVKELREGT